MASTSVDKGRHWLIAVCLAVAVHPVAAQSELIRVDSDSILVYPIRHGTLVLQSGNKTLFVDPVGSEEVFEYFGDPDRILITDANDGDLNMDLLVALTAKKTTVVAPRAVVERMPFAERAQTRMLGDGDVLEMDDIGIEAVSLQDPSPGRSIDAGDRGNGYVVTLAEERIYISGDAKNIQANAALEDIDIAFVSLGMGVAAAADAVLDFKPRIVYPYRYRTDGTIADLDRFKELVSADSSTEVHQLDWYPEIR